MKDESNTHKEGRFFVIGRFSSQLIIGLVYVQPLGLSFSCTMLKNIGLQEFAYIVCPICKLGSL